MIQPGVWQRPRLENCCLLSACVHNKHVYCLRVCGGGWTQGESESSCLRPARVAFYRLHSCKFLCVIDSHQHFHLLWPLVLFQNCRGCVPLMKLGCRCSLTNILSEENTPTNLTSVAEFCSVPKHQSDPLKRQGVSYASSSVSLYLGAVQC